MKKILFKTILLLFIFITLFSCLSSVYANSFTIHAAERDISEYYLKINFHGSGNWVFPFARYTYYIKDNKEYPAYCINELLPGAYESGSYAVSAKEIVKDPKLWRVLKKGYGFRTPAEMGLETADQAYLATRFAVFCVLYDYEVDDRYRANDEVGEKIIAAMKEMVNYARNGTDTYIEPTVSIAKNDSTFVETINGIEYVSQKYTLSQSVPLLSYSVKFENFPEGTKIFNLSNTETSEFTDNNFKISIPLLNIPKNISGTIFIEDIKLKSYPILVGIAPNPELQNYALITEDYEVKTTKTTLNLEFSGDIKIYKYSSEHNEILDLPEGSPLSGAEFTVTTEDGRLIGTYTTNENGYILIEDLPLGTYIITETKAPEHFIIDSEPQIVTISENKECVEVTFDNIPDNPPDTPPDNPPDIPQDTPKYGNIKIYKYSDGYNYVLDFPDNSPLAGAEFTVTTEDGSLIGTYTTNKDGSILIENLPLGTYVITETKAPEHFIRNSEPQTITLSENEECYEITFDNIPDNPPLPKTGC